MRVAITLFLLLGLAVGCQSSSRARNEPASTVRNRAELALQLSRFLENLRSDVVGTTGQVALQTTDLTVRDTALRFRLRATANIDRLMLEPIPEEQFLQCWIMAVREQMSVRDGLGGPRFADQQHLMDSMTLRMEVDLLKLGGEFYPQEALDAAKDEVQREARQQLGTMVDESSRRQVPQQRPSDLSRIATLPLAPFTGLQGVADTPQEIARFTEVAARLTEIVRRLPERSRWEAQLMLLNSQEIPAVAKALQEIELSRLALDKAVTTVQGLPADTRREITVLLEDLQRRQPELLAVVDRATKAVNAAEAMLAQAERSATEVRKTAADVERLIERTQLLAADTTAAAKAWEQLILVIREGNDQSNSATAPAEDEPDRVGQWMSMMSDARVAAVELRGLLADIDALGGKDSPLSGLRGDADAVMDTAFWRGVWLMVVAFGLATVWLFIRRAVNTRASS
jgi:hypothetical protein